MKYLSLLILLSAASGAKAYTARAMNCVDEVNTTTPAEYVANTIAEWDSQQHFSGLFVPTDEIAEAQLKEFAENQRFLKPAMYAFIVNPNG